MSKFIDASRRAERLRAQPGAIGTRQASEPPDDEPRAYRVVAVTNNKGGVGKTTVATNLAVYFRALREDVPVLVIGFDDQPTIDRMFALDREPADKTVTNAMREGSFAASIRLGEYGVHYVPSCADVGKLHGELRDERALRRALDWTDWRGVVVVDTKSDLGILTRNAIAAADAVAIPVRDTASLLEAEKVFDLIAGFGRPRETGRVLLSMVDRRIKYRELGGGDLLALLLEEIRRRGHPVFESFLSASPKVEALATNPSGRVHSVLHGAGGSIVHRQMAFLARDVLAMLGLEASPPREPR